MFLLGAYLTFVLISNIFAVECKSGTHELGSSLENKQGSCMPVTECKPIVSTLLSKQPLSQDIINALRKLQCGFDGQTPKVWCPSEDTDYPKLMKSSEITKNSSKTALSPNLSTCGLFTPNRYHSYTRSALKEYPWNALLGHKTGNVTKFHCGGALISNRYVLTAAHCITRGDNFELSSVRLGEYNTNENPDCERIRLVCTDKVVEVPIEKVIVHEQYNPNDPNRHFNVALIRLAENVTFTKSISPVCLPPLSKLNESDNFMTRRFAISGWGISAGRQEVDVKYHIALNLTDVNECKASPKYANKTLQANQLCASPLPGHNNCYADDGAVLVAIIREYGTYANFFAIGVTSFDIDKCSEGPDNFIFTKLKDYVPWIYNNVEW